MVNNKCNNECVTGPTEHTESRGGIYNLQGLSYRPGEYFVLKIKHLTDSMMTSYDKQHLVVSIRFTVPQG